MNHSMDNAPERLDRERLIFLARYCGDHAEEVRGDAEDGVPDRCDLCAVRSAEERAEAAELRANEAEAACAGLIKREDEWLIREADGALVVLERDRAHQIGRQWIADARALVKALRRCVGSIAVHAMETGEGRETLHEAWLRGNEALATPLARRLAGEAKP